jgi:hypothetical protein
LFMAVGFGELELEQPTVITTAAASSTTQGRRIPEIRRENCN